MLLTDVVDEPGAGQLPRVRGFFQAGLMKRWSGFRTVFGGWVKALLARLQGSRPKNPYLAGPPILEPSRFVGRRQLVERVMRSIHNNSLFLQGERKIGKTSLLRHLEHRLQSLEDSSCVFHPVWVDLRDTPQELFFTTLSQAVFRSLAHRLGGLQPSEASSPPNDFGYRRVAGDLRRIVEVLDRQTSKKVKVVLLIDEIDVLNAYDPRINQRLRSLFMTGFGDNLVAVVAGVTINKEWEREGSPWYNFFEEIEVPPLAWREAEELITTPVRGDFRWTSAAVELILDRSDGKPYQIQELCGKAVERALSRRRRTIRRSDVERAVQAGGHSVVIS